MSVDAKPKLRTFCVVMATHVAAPDQQQAVDHVALRSPAGSVVVSVEEFTEGDHAKPSRAARRKGRTH